MRTNDKDLQAVDMMGKEYGVRVRPAAIGASVYVDGVETYYRSKTEAANAATAIIVDRMAQ